MSGFCVCFVLFCLLQYKKASGNQQNFLKLYRADQSLYYLVSLNSKEAMVHEGEGSSKSSQIMHSLGNINFTHVLGALVLKCHFTKLRNK